MSFVLKYCKNITIYKCYECHYLTQVKRRRKKNELTLCWRCMPETWEIRQSPGLDCCTTQCERESWNPQPSMFTHMHKWPSPSWCHEIS